MEEGLRYRGHRVILRSSRIGCLLCDLECDEFGSRDARDVGSDGGGELQCNHSLLP